MGSGGANPRSPQTAVPFLDGNTRPTTELLDVSPIAAAGEALPALAPRMREGFSVEALCAFQVDVAK